MRDRLYCSGRVTTHPPTHGEVDFRIYVEMSKILTLGTIYVFKSSLYYVCRALYTICDNFRNFQIARVVLLMRYYY
jgi:hypothetical protein